MRRWIYDDEEEEVEETDSEEYDDEDEDDEDDEDDDEALFARVDRAYRQERARVRASEDIAKLREMRETYQEQLMDGTLHGIAAVRAGDLVEQIDDRITDLRARRRTGGGW